jgi:Raf kinase inhibitor-like YbhB/YbcL family protein
LRVAALVCVALGLAACGSAASQSHPPFVPHIKLSSPAFAPGANIPTRYTCDGADVSLALRWTGVPSHATSLTLTMNDRNAPGGSFIHWELTGIPASITRLSSGQVPPGVTQGANGFGTTGYRGPCPPHGDPPHHYVISVTVLRGRRPIAVGELVGTYRRR